MKGNEPSRTPTLKIRGRSVNLEREAPKGYNSMVLIHDITTRVPALAERIVQDVGYTEGA